MVRTLDHEIMTSFAAAAADVNEHFSALIAMLFPGGTGRLMLLEPDDLLNTGVEIEVRPAGRNVRRVSLLSGGERSMAALAFLFAVFRSRPSPFYMMDEVEAALDDVNLSRFLALVHEFRDEAQLLIVSHQKRTMETGDASVRGDDGARRLVPGRQPEGGEGEGAGVTGHPRLRLRHRGRHLRRGRRDRRRPHPPDHAGRRGDEYGAMTRRPTPKRPRRWRRRRSGGPGERRPPPVDDPARTEALAMIGTLIIIVVVVVVLAVALGGIALTRSPPACRRRDDRRHRRPRPPASAVTSGHAVADQRPGAGRSARGGGRARAAVEPEPAVEAPGAPPRTGAASAACAASSVAPWPRCVRAASTRPHGSRWRRR